VVAGPSAAREDGIRLFGVDSEGDDCRWRRCGVAAEPGRIVRAGGRRQVVCGAENLDRTAYAVVADGNAEMSLLLRRQGVADGSDFADEVVPADFLAEVLIVGEGKIAQRSARSEWKHDGHHVSANGSEADIKDGRDHPAGDFGKSFEPLRANDGARGEKHGIRS